MVSFTSLGEKLSTICISMIALKVLSTVVYKFNVFSLRPFVPLSTFFPFDVFPVDVIYYSTFCLCRRFLRSTLFLTDVFSFSKFCPFRCFYIRCFFQSTFFYFSTFCPSRHFFTFYVFSSKRFYFSTFCPSPPLLSLTFCPSGRFVLFGVSSCDVLSVDVFHCGRFLL